MSQDEIDAFRAQEPTVRKELRDEAAFLTKSLYRLCLRSVCLIRPGNEHDEAEFGERERQRLEDENSPRRDDDSRMGTFSILPPVDRDDELRSRAEYYHQFARENLFQETDCLPLGDKELAPLHEQDVQRFTFLLKKGDSDRHWLLQDMEFPDPYKKSFPKDMAKQFEAKALAYIQERQRVQQSISGIGGGGGGSQKSTVWDAAALGYEVEEGGDDGDGDGDFFDDEDDGEEVPAWLQNHVAKK